MLSHEQEANLSALFASSLNLAEAPSPIDFSAQKRSADDSFHQGRKATKRQSTRQLPTDRAFPESPPESSQAAPSEIGTFYSFKAQKRKPQLGPTSDSRDLPNSALSRQRASFELAKRASIGPSALERRQEEVQSLKELFNKRIWDKLPEYPIDQPHGTLLALHGSLSERSGDSNADRYHIVEMAAVFLERFFENYPELRPSDSRSEWPQGLIQAAFSLAVQAKLKQPFTSMLRPLNSDDRSEEAHLQRLEIKFVKGTDFNWDTNRATELVDQYQGCVEALQAVKDAFQVNPLRLFNQLKRPSGNAESNMSHRRPRPPARLVKILEWELKE